MAALIGRAGTVALAAAAVTWLGDPAALADSGPGIPSGPGTPSGPVAPPGSAAAATERAETPRATPLAARATEATDSAAAHPTSGATAPPSAGAMAAPAQARTIAPATVTGRPRRVAPAAERVAPPSGAAANTTAPVIRAYAADGAIQRAVDDAVARATSQGYLSGLAVVDGLTGRAYTAGAATAYFPTESTVKVLIAANLLATGRMSGSTAALATYMIQASDDAAANRLYGLTPGDGLVAWAAARYGIGNLGARPNIGPGWWGSTQVSPAGFALFLAAARADPAVGPWLYSTMAGIRDVASDGTNQVFGLHAADPAGAVKHGWGGDTPGGNSTMTPSVGWVGPGGRWSVALFTGHVPATSYAASMAVATASAMALMAGLTAAS